MKTNGTFESTIDSVTLDLEYLKYLKNKFRDFFDIIYLVIDTIQNQV